MLPISLKIEGLNSYAREAYVDFTRFYKTRLFGIFGDTGGGKSTILDAIILSLYGEIPRLGSRKIKEAINPFTKKINLEFSFTISGEKYIITRTISFDDNRVKLYHIKDDKKITLAEKPKEFNEKIREIIGLNVEEFYKVVILPQNQFAKLLQIDPAERAELMGNIFDISYLGRPLYEKFNEKLIRIDSQLREKQKKLSEISDISVESIEKKVTELRQLTADLKILNDKHREISEKINQINNFIQLNRRKQEIESEIKKIEVEKEKIEEFKMRIQIDEKLAPYKKLLDELKVLEISIRENRENKEKIERKLEETEKKLEIFKKEWEIFEREFTRRNEELIKFITESDRWIELSNEVKKLKVQREQRTQELKELESAIAKIEEKIKKIDQEIEKLVRDIEKKNQLVENYRLKEEETNLYEILPTVLPKINEIKNLSEEIKKINKELLNEKKKENNTFESIQNLARKKLNLIINENEDIEKIIENRGWELRENLKRVKENFENLSIKNLAFVLSKTLSYGEPCPVCGSTVHPKPAKSVNEDEMIATEKKIKSIEEDLEKLENFRLEIRPNLKILIETKTTIDGYERDVQQKKNKLTIIERELSELLDRKYWENADVLFKNLTVKKKEADKLIREINELNKELNEKITFKNTQTQEKIRLITTVEQIRKNLEDLDKQIFDKEEKLIKNTGGRDPLEIKKNSEKELEDLKRKKNNYEENMKKYEEERQTATVRLEKIKEVLLKDEKRSEEISTSLEILAREIGVSKEKLGELLLDEEIRKKYRKQIEDHEKTYNSLKGALENIIRSIHELPIKNVSSELQQRLEKELNDLNKKIAELNEKSGILKEQIQREKAILEEKKVLTDEVKNLERSLENLKLLRNLTEGKEMIKFVSWHLLVKIVELSNQLLKELLGRRFQLNVTPNLEFIVTDLHYNKERSVNTLSGGETFLVSFALALSLSNYIQSKRKRAIQFFFIDEGFSSLDKELLDSLCAVLNELRSQDRLVGLITHIEDLKQVIPQCINIKRDRTGSSIILYNT